MPWDKLHLLRAILSFILPYSLTILRQKISAIRHSYTYKPLPLPLPSSSSSSSPNYKNVIVIGGSFAGYQATKRLTQTLPTGYRVILVEKNSHLNYLFAFPRFSVLRNRTRNAGLEKYAFIPYSGLTKGAPDGIVKVIQDTVIDIGDGFVRLEQGGKVDYAFLILATGTSSPPPSKYPATSQPSGNQQLRAMQDRIFAAQQIAVVGGGAVGVELSGDIKSYYPEKEVVLVHSRQQLMGGFGMRLHEFAVRTLGELGVEVWLGERPGVPGVGEKRELRFKDGRVEEFDLIIPTTGQTPNSTLLTTLSPPSISKSTSRILVQPTLQIIDPLFPHIFALGDVAETGAPKMARAAHFQSEVVVANILRLIDAAENEQEMRKGLRLVEYKPNVAFEGSIKLTLGKKRLALYMQEDDGREILVPFDGGSDDMGVKMQWRFFGADLKAFEREDGGVEVEGSVAQKVIEAAV